MNKLNNNNRTWQVENPDLILGERPATRRRPFAMNLEKRGSELLIPEGSAPLAQPSPRETSAIARPRARGARPFGVPPGWWDAARRRRTAPPADKMFSGDGEPLRSRSARARPRRNHAAALGARETPNGARPRMSDRAATAAEARAAAQADLGLRLLQLVFVYL